MCEGRHWDSCVDGSEMSWSTSQSCDTTQYIISSGVFLKGCGVLDTTTGINPFLRNVDVNSALTGPNRPTRDLGYCSQEHSPFSTLRVPVSSSGTLLTPSLTALRRGSVSATSVVFDPLRSFLRGDLRRLSATRVIGELKPEDGRA